MMIQDTEVSWFSPLIASYTKTVGLNKLHLTAGYVSASSILGASQNELEEKLGLSSFHIRNFTDAVISHALPKKISGIVIIYSYYIIEHIVCSKAVP